MNYLQLQTLYSQLILEPSKPEKFPLGENIFCSKKDANDVEQALQHFRKSFSDELLECLWDTANTIEHSAISNRHKEKMQKIAINKFKQVLENAGIKNVEALLESLPKFSLFLAAQNPYGSSKKELWNFIKSDKALQEIPLSITDKELELQLVKLFPSYKKIVSSIITGEETEDEWISFNHPVAGQMEINIYENEAIFYPVNPVSHSILIDKYFAKVSLSDWPLS